MRPKIPMQIPPLTGAANVTICHLSGSGKCKQSLGDRDIYGTFKTMLCHRQSFFFFEYSCLVSSLKNIPSLYSWNSLENIHCVRKCYVSPGGLLNWRIEEESNSIKSANRMGKKRVTPALYHEKYPRRPRSRCSRHTLPLQQRSSHLRFASERTPSAWRLHTAYVLFNSMTSRATTPVVAEGEVQ